MWDIQTGKPQGKPIDGHGLSLTGLVADPSRQSLVSASWDGDLRKWQPETGQQIGRPLHPRGGASVLVLHPSLRSVWTGNEEGRLLEVELDERSPLERQSHVLSSELSVSARSRGKRLAVGGWDKQITLFRVDAGGLQPDKVLRGHDGSISAWRFRKTAQSWHRRALTRRCGCGWARGRPRRCQRAAT
ncbi:MAG: WD40 repeat domain-containing protein [Polyangia bacterium]